MLSPEYYESCAQLILQQYADLEDAILRDIIRRLMKRGFVTDSAKWQAEMLQEAGLLYNDIVQEISDRTDACAEQVKTLFEDAGVQTVQIDNEIYREAGLVPVDIRQSPSMRQVLEAGYRKTLGQLDNLTKTMPSAGQRLYINACNQAYMKVTSGAFSYQQAIMQAVRDTAASGMKMIQYDSGHADRVETAVRRAVLTGVGQTCREIGRMNAEENGCSLMEITAHSGARPEHAVWQGQLVDLTGRRAGEVVDGKRVLSLSAIGYGQITGFGGVNCRHDWYPYFEGISVPNYTVAQLKDLDARNIPYNGEMYTQYEISQMQRAGERKVRAWKRRCITSQEAVKSAPDEVTKATAQAEYSKSAVKLKAAEKSLKDFCKQTGQDRDRFREQVVGFGRSQAQRAVQTAKRSQNTLTSGKDSGIMRLNRSSKNGTKPTDKHYYEKVGTLDIGNSHEISKSIIEFERKYHDSEIEHCLVIAADGTVYEVHGDRYTVDTSLLGEKLKGSINEHNHVTGESQYSFSWDDLESSIIDGSKISIAFDEKYRYSMLIKGEIDADFIHDVKEKAKETVYDRIISGEDIAEENIQHEMIKCACEILGITYRRTSK